MNKHSDIIKIMRIIDIVDTVDFVGDLDADSTCDEKLDEICCDEEFCLDDIRIPQRPLRDMTNPIEMFSRMEFQQRYSLSKETVVYVLDLIVHGLERSTNRGKPVPPLIELLITIRFMTTGTFQSMIDDIHGVSQPTISRLIVKVSTLLAELRHIFIQCPGPADTRRITKAFYADTHFPNLIGCLGATHVGIKNPGGQISEAYLNEHGYYSLKVQMICGPNLEFLDFLSRWPGSTHESKIFDISEMRRRLDASERNGLLLASATYPQVRNLLTPVRCPKTAAETKYNNAHRATYNVCRAVELWKKRFKCLTTVLANKEETTRAIIHATAVLHNIALKHNEQLPEANRAEPVCEPKGKEIKRVFPLDKPLASDPAAVLLRDQFIREHFG